MIISPLSITSKLIPKSVLIKLLTIINLCINLFTFLFLPITFSSISKNDSDITFFLKPIIFKLIIKSIHWQFLRIAKIMACSVGWIIRAHVYRNKGKIAYYLTRGEKQLVRNRIAFLRVTYTSFHNLSIVNSALYSAFTAMRNVAISRPRVESTYAFFQTAACNRLLSPRCYEKICIPSYQQGLKEEKK